MQLMQIPPAAPAVSTADALCVLLGCLPACQSLSPNSIACLAICLRPYLRTGVSCVAPCNRYRQAGSRIVVAQGARIKGAQGGGVMEQGQVGSRTALQNETAGSGGGSEGGSEEGTALCISGRLAADKQ